MLNTNSVFELHGFYADDPCAIHLTDTEIIKLNQGH